MSCLCNYSQSNNGSCVSCINVTNGAADANITQKRIWRQVRAPASMYVMNLASMTSGASRLAAGVNWNQMSDRVSAAKQTVVIPTQGNSVRATLTSGRPGAASPGGVGVDVKHDSYARFLNKKKAAVLKTQTHGIAAVPLYGNKIKSIGLLANTINCCN